ncbi:MAG: alpha/beta hydrolase [Candidatus Izimaplasma sp.]|nr:alpha/beta hydrolase [Candidatus Izimaplasma bacterium]
MKLLILPGIACDRSIWKDINWSDHDVTILEYDNYMDKTTETVEDIAQKILNDPSLSQYDGIIAHSMGGFIGAIILDKVSSLARFFIAIETSFVPANPSYQTLLYGEDSNLKIRIQNMFDTEIKHYPESLIKFLQGAFDYEYTLQRIAVPTTLIYGTREMTEEDELKNKLNLSDKTINGLTLIFIDKAAHFPMLEQPSKTNEIILNILKKYE